MAIYNCFLIPFEISFQPESLASVNFLILNTLIDICFGIDIFINFRTTFYHPVTGDEISDLNIIRMVYFKGRFILDLLSTIPFDNLFHIFSDADSGVLGLFSLLKLFRVNRLGRIIARLNVSEDAKNSLKLFQLIFFIIMYIHCSGCAWYSIIKESETWVAPLDMGDDPNFLYDDTLVRKYIVCIYHSSLLMMGNDIFPVGDF